MSFCVFLFLLLFTFRMSLSRRNEERKKIRKWKEKHFNGSMCSLWFSSCCFSWKLLSCIFMDENQLAKISFAGEIERKLFPCIEKLWKAMPSGSQRRQHRDKDWNSRFSPKLLCKWDQKILQLNWTDVTINFTLKTLHILEYQNSFHISQNRLI